MRRSRLTNNKIGQANECQIFQYHRNCIRVPESGKSYFAGRLAKTIHAEYVNSDQLRMEMYPKRTYSESEEEAVYNKMLNKMNEAFTQNKSVVLDAPFHKESLRNVLQQTLWVTFTS